MGETRGHNNQREKHFGKKKSPRHCSLFEPKEVREGDRKIKKRRKEGERE